MKKTFVALVAIAILSGCAHEGGVSDPQYRESEPAKTAPGTPTTMDRDFPGRTGPGMDQPVDPARR